MIKRIEDNKEQISVYSIFNSIQGEGLDSGKPTQFIRLAGCPFRCPYCDEKQALLIDNGKKYFIIELIDEIRKTNPDFSIPIEITGGSPEWQQNTFTLVETIRRVASKLQLEDDNIKTPYITIQASGGIALTRYEISLFDKVKLDFKDYEITKIKMETNLSYLRKYDEIKLIYKDEQTLIDILEHKTKDCKARVILTTMSEPHMNVLDEKENWKKLTEFVIENQFLNKYKDRLYVMPRLQQLYWLNEKNK